MSTEIPTQPIGYADQHAPHLVLQEAYTAEDGSVYVHRDLVRAVEAWEIQEHVGPPREQAVLGDVESWAEYIKRYGLPDYTLATWDERGLRATLDYHTLQDGGRCAWHAQHPFTRSSQWLAWAKLADGQPRSQRALLEALEDLAEDIIEPGAADLLGLLRTLRATVKAQADTELAEDGSTRVTYAKDASVRSGGELSLPPSLDIVIPVLKGHVTPSEGGEGPPVPVRYRLTVRLRVSVDDQAKLAFRLSIPGAERVLEAVFADRVQAAKDALGEAYPLLRSAAP